MKILLATESYWPNSDGGAVFERQLAYALNKKGHEVTIWAPNTTWRGGAEQDGPTRIIRSATTPLPFNPRYRVSIGSKIRVQEVFNTVQPDILHAHIAWKLGASAAREARKRAIPVVATNHFMPENAILHLPKPLTNTPFLEKAIWKHLVRFHNRCTFVTSPTQTAVHLLTQHGLHVPSKAVSNGIDLSRIPKATNTKTIQEQYQLPRTSPYLIYVGRLDKEKRVDILLTALAQAKNPAHVVLVGTGNAKAALEAHCNTQGLAHRVTFTGFVPDEHKWALLQGAAGFVISSPSELQSIVTLEAMACSLPILAADVGALRELCRHGENGYLCKPNSPSHLAKYMDTLLADPKTRREFGAQSRKIIEEEHQFSTTIDTFESIYKDLLLNKQSLRKKTQNR